MTIDDDIQAALRNGERAVPLDPEADERVRSRMLVAFSDETTDVVVELDLTEQPAAERSRPRRRPMILAAAAAVVVIAGAIGLTLANRDAGDDSSRVAAATPDETDMPATTQPSAIGYLPFSGYSWLADASTTEEASVQFLDRAGEVRVDPDGSTVLAVRRQTSGSVLLPQEDTGFDVTTTADGRTIVPIEVVIPILVSGPVNGCVGGAVEVGPFAPDQDLTVTCDGQAAELRITVDVGTPELLPLLEEPVSATPVTFTMSTAAEVIGVSTHWYDDWGLVRQDVERLGVVYEIEMTPGDLIRRNIDLGLIDDQN